MSIDREKLRHSIRSAAEESRAEDADRVGDLSGVQKAVEAALRIFDDNPNGENIKHASTHLRFALAKIRRLREESGDATSKAGKKRAWPPINKPVTRADGGPPIQPAPNGVRTVSASKMRAAVMKVVAASKLAGEQA